MIDRQKAKAVFSLFLYSLPLLYFLYLCYSHNISSDTLLEYRDHFFQLKEAHKIIFALVFVCCYSGVVATSITITAALNILAGYLFGPLTGALLASIGVITGSHILFVFSRRTMAGLNVPQLVPQRTGRECGENFIILLCLRLSPLVPATLITVGSAATRMRKVFFLTTTFLGSFPLLLIYAMLGSHLADVEHLGQIYDSSLVQILVLLSLISFAPLLKPEVRKLVTGGRKKNLLSVLALVKKYGIRKQEDKRDTVRISSGQFARLLALGDECFMVRICSRVRGLNQQGILVDISRLGMGIRLPGHALNEKDTISLETRLGRHKVSCMAVVRWVRGDRLGIEYVHPRPMDWSFLPGLEGA